MEEAGLPPDTDLLTSLTHGAGLDKGSLSLLILPRERYMGDLTCAPLNLLDLGPDVRDLGQISLHAFSG